jgi:hypothetical protein
MLLRWVRPQHADDDVIQEAPNEGLASRSPREDIGASDRVKVRPATGSTGPV